jgi:Mn-containing catalase
MYHHVRNLCTPLASTNPIPIAALLLEQFGGANGQRPAATQYSIQGLFAKCPPARLPRARPTSSASTSRSRPTP